MLGCLMDSEVWKMWKESVPVSIQALSQNFPYVTGKNHRHLSQDGRSPGQDLNLVLLESEATFPIAAPHDRDCQFCSSTLQMGSYDVII